MEKNTYSGKFIVFEGLDGSGQSTQVRLLGEFLENKGYSVLKTKEPTIDSEAGKKIRRVLEEKEKISPKELQGLFAEDRKEHLKNLIIPALKDNKIVISDRYFFTSFSYSRTLNLPYQWLKEINNEFLLPDLVFFLDVKAETCLERIKNRGEGEELFEKKEFLEQSYQNFKKTFEEFRNQCKIYFIDGEKSIEKVFTEVKENTEKQLKI